MPHLHLGCTHGPISQPVQDQPWKMTKPRFAAVCSLTTAPITPPSSLFVRKLSHPLPAFLPVGYLECQPIPFPFSQDVSPFSLQR